MSQVLLGFRNLALRLAVFVALAALLVWFLGGNMFARSQVFPLAVATTGAGDGRLDVRLEQVILPVKGLPSDRIFFRVLFDGADAAEPPMAFASVSDLVEIDPGGLNRAVWFAAEQFKPGGGTAGVWCVYRLTPYATRPELMLEVADRLEAERQLARVKAGLPLQTGDAARAARDAVLRAGDAP
ncbi:MAG: hypothetical protein GC172_09390 [Phycisphaera sp.]|nr:hypothetical protein [Phycisphaera sp.]